MRKRLLIVMALLVAAGTLQAQQLPPGKWWRRAEVVRQLELTREQQDRLDTVFRNAANTLIDAKAEVEKLQVALRGELDRNELRRQEIQNIAAQLTQARGRLFDRELMMLVDMRGVLDEEQWNRLRTSLDRMQDRMGQRNQRPPMGGQRQGPGQGPGPGRRRP